ncbi:sunset domain-containing protein [Lactobacillus sp. PSON]|uniref:sunset domain-containing protein n=1 Tax=Lactobacillus sp. PSON TaxID=3455454 RepID=UPI004043938F
MQKFWNIIRWILFWYYLIPYYLLKKYIFRGKHQIAWSSIGSLVVVFALFITWMNNISDDSESAESASKPRVHYVVKKVGKAELASAKTKNKLLAKEEAKKEAEYEKLKDELDSQKEKEQAEKEQAEEAAKKQKSEEQKAARRVAKQKREAEDIQKSDDDSDNDSDSGTGAGRGGDMNTAETGKIVGNVNSHIYHTPGQAGYRMNSANAVYFDSEQDAINAGYRKAKR